MNHLARMGPWALTFLLLLAGAALAGDDQPANLLRTTVLGGEHVGHAPSTAKAERDTVYLMGGPGNYQGQFQDQYGNPTWHQWESIDLTYSDEIRWNVSDYLPINGAYSQLCGVMYDNDCGFGYGNNWNEELLFAYEVANPQITTQGNIVADLAVDTEEGFDYVYLEVNLGGSWSTLGVWDAVQQVAVDADFTVAANQYVNGEVQLRFRFTSDIGWSDEDCLYDSEGPARVDDVIVRLDGDPVSSENFEDGLSQDWAPQISPGVGDYAYLYNGLQELDPCGENVSPQVAFIDDGVVVPGTGGSPCVTWCYGPGGYIVNCTGGLMGPAFHIDNAIRTQVFAWPEGMSGAYLEVDAYTHEPLGPSSPGMFWQWHVRSTDGADPANIEGQGWFNRNKVNYSVNPLGDYARWHMDVSDLLVPNRSYLQVQLKVFEYGWVWGYNGVDGYPAPYFDNISLVAYPFEGPAINATNTNLAQDNFPERGDIDYVNLANNWVRFDMGRNISPQSHLRNDPGDSIFIDVAAVRDGAILHGTPRMYYRMKANPVYDGVRVLPPNATRDGAIVDGWTDGHRTYDNQGHLIDTEFWFDLPDSDFFFPGDVIHYFFAAQDEVPGGDIGTTLVPADTAGYASFYHDLTFNSDFIVRALPTMFSAVPGDQPNILWWNDFANYGGENEWMFALWNNGYYEGIDYDVFYTIDPDGALGNGLGSRATSSMIQYYDVLMYCSGTLSVNTIANGDFNNEPSPDLQLLDNWFQLGDRSALLTGDELISSVNAAGAEGMAFVNEYCGVRLGGHSLHEVIDGQTSPTVLSISGNSVFTLPTWVAFGGCPAINSFDVIEPVGTTERLAEFAGLNGMGGAYPYAAATLHINESVNSKVVVLPYDFMWFNNAQGYEPSQEGMAARALALQEILLAFGIIPINDPTDVPGREVFAVSQHPNPFNPQTTITLRVPQAGRVSLKVYDLRGALVRTLVDGQLAAGEHPIVWNGTDDRGAAASSGVYFYEARLAGETRLGKMTLLK